jgi:hypothetical protein
MRIDRQVRYFHYFRVKYFDKFPVLVFIEVYVEFQVKCLTLTVEAPIKISSTSELPVFLY